MPSDFDQTGCLMVHTALLNELRLFWERRGYSVLTEGQNSFTVRGSSAALAGKPDLVARRGYGVSVIYAKTGRPNPQHAVQVMVYMCALPGPWSGTGGSPPPDRSPTQATWWTSRLPRSMRAWSKTSFNR